VVKPLYKLIDNIVLKTVNKNRFCSVNLSVKELQEYYKFVLNVVCMA